MLHHQPQILSPLPEINPQASDSPPRGRKMSTSGNRSWSEEEENYLLQTRMQKMPYKHIAAHLKKTELACRLHYHQLSHGSHRRRRTSSVSSAASNSSAGHSSSYGQTPELDNYSQSSRHSSPMSYNGSPHIRDNSLTASPGRAQHKILLPKPRTHTPSESPEPYGGLRLNTEVAHQPKVVDTDRLRSIYEARRNQFWATVAADYGSDVSPAQLEEIWRNGSNAVRPPTPDASPDGSNMNNGPLDASLYRSYPTSSYSEPARHYRSSPPTNMSSVPAPERPSYVLPMPILSNGRSRAGTWSSAPRDTMPIASILNHE